MKVLYLYSGSREGLLEKTHKGEYHGNGFWGMLYLPEHGIKADYIEIEQYLPKFITRFLRRIINIYFIHLFLFWKFFFYDIIFTSAAFGSQLLYSILRLRKPLWVMHDFSITGLLGEEKTFRQKVFRYMVSRSAGIVTLSTDEKERLQKRFPHLKDKIEFIPFGVNLGFFKPLKDFEKRQILSVGLDPDRDWKTLIKACSDIDVPVVLVTKTERIKQYLPLPPHFKVRQFTSKDLAEEYARSAIVVVPLNTSSGINNAMGCSVLFEAMASGRPVVITRTKTTESYVKNGENGILVDEGDSLMLRKTIKTLLNDKALRERLGDNAYQYAKINFDAKKCAALLADFFKRI